MPQSSSTRANGNSDRICAAIRAPCAAGSQWESAAPTRTSDRECRALQSCTNEQYIHLAETSTSDRVCVNHPVCLGTEYVSRVATTTKSRLCQTITQCYSATQTTKTPATQTSDNYCDSPDNSNACRDWQYEHVAAPNRECRARTTCASTQYEKSAGIPKLTNRVCEDLTVCSAMPAQSVLVATAIASALC